MAGRCAMMHVVILLAKRIQKPISHIDWRIESVDVRFTVSSILTDGFESGL